MYFSILSSRQIYIEWKANPTVTTINTSAYPIKNVEFPAITICSQGAAKDILDTALWNQFERYLNSTGKIKAKVNQNEKPKSGRLKRSPQSVVDDLSKEEVDKVKLNIFLHMKHLN